MKFKSLIAGLMCLSLGGLAFAQEQMSTPGTYGGGLPPNPTPGQCFVHKFFPPQFSTNEIDLTIKDAYKTVTITPAVFETVPIVVPTSDAFTNFSVTPPEFQTKDVKIQISPDGAVWQVNCCKDDHHRKPGEPCEQACYKPLKPEFKVFQVQIRIRDGGDTPFNVPATTTTVNFKKLVTPPKINIIDHPAVVIKIAIKKLVNPGHMEWVPGTCGKYTCDPKKLQAALKKEGFYNGKVDGNVTEATITAMNKFREAKGLGIHPEMDKETADALGIEA